MEVVFNELSFLPHCENEHVLKLHFLNMLKLFGSVKEKYGFKHIVFPTNIGAVKVLNAITFHEWIYGMQDQGKKNTILSFVRRPFGDDILEEQINELNKYYYNNDQAGLFEKFCTGLAISYLKNKVSISLATNLCWNVSQISFKEIVDDDLNVEDIYVNNIASEEHIEVRAVQNGLLYSGKLELVGTPMNAGKKNISLRNDHGKDKLKKFSDQLVKSHYVLSVINSLPFNPTSLNLIRNVFADGKIELVLHWEDAGYGIIIQSTGRNLRETEEIAKILKNKFDR